MGSQFPSLIGRWAWQGPTSPAVGGALREDPWLWGVPSSPGQACFLVTSWTSARSCSGPGAQQDGHNLLHARLLKEPDTERATQRPPRLLDGLLAGGA